MAHIVGKYFEGAFGIPYDSKLEAQRFSVEEMRLKPKKFEKLFKIFDSVAKNSNAPLSVEAQAIIEFVVNEERFDMNPSVIRWFLSRNYTNWHSNFPFFVEQAIDEFVSDDNPFTDNPQEELDEIIAETFNDPANWESELDDIISDPYNYEAHQKFLNSEFYQRIIENWNDEVHDWSKIMILCGPALDIQNPDVKSILKPFCKGKIPFYSLVQGIFVGLVNTNFGGIQTENGSYYGEDFGYEQLELTFGDLLVLWAILRGI